MYFIAKIKIKILKITRFLRKILSNKIKKNFRTIFFFF